MAKPSLIKGNFNGMTVVSFESRMAGPMEKLIERYGGRPIVAPSMREVPLEKNEKAFALFEDLKNGRVDLLILLTGVATRTFIATLEKKFAKEEILEVLRRTQICVRGPKPTAVCRVNNIPIAVTAPEPNTWREIITILTEEGRLAGKNVAILEYGISNRQFLDELSSLGARVNPVPVYQWALPEDLRPLHSALDTLIRGDADLALFTTSVQIDHMMKITRERGDEGKLRRAFYRVGICSIGPVTSERLREFQLFPDLEAKPNKIDILVNQSAVHSAKIVKKKRERLERWCEVRVTTDHGPMMRHGEAYLVKRISPEKTLHASRFTLHDKLVTGPFLRACRLQKNATIPVWFMRQAGRYMAEYQMVRNKASFLELCKNSDLAAEVTLSAVERLGVDAAIIFSDILLPVEAMGLPLEYREGVGPLIAQPIRDGAGIAALSEIDVRTSLPFVFESIRKTRKSLHPRIPLIGFCGAPFTVASYMIEGKGSRNYIPTKNLMHSEPMEWKLLMEKLTRVLTDHLNAQIDAGCQAVQIFDSWVGCLSPEDYRKNVLPYSRKLIRGIRKGTPVIHFGTFSEPLLPLVCEASGHVISIDWRFDLRRAARTIGPKKGLQGNLDPAVLFSRPKVIFEEARRILKMIGSRPGFIFNLGHGILPETPVDHVMALVDFVHGWNPAK